uniref:Chromosome 11 open reading frame 54 n=1 Tax=Macaca nemestrina TaxID=9545 RepID=A0A2K6AV59_MACNE
MTCAEFSFHVPSLEELAGVMQKGLKDNFADVQVSVVDCPDLTEEPFTFPVKGICGKTRIAEVGGVPYLLPLVNQKKVYDLNKIAKEIKLPGAFILGAGAGPFQTLGFNSEVIEVKAKRRTGPLNFVTCMRQTLEKHYGNKPVGMGGTFIIQKGKVKSHIMVRAHVCSFWFGLPVLVSRDPSICGFDLRLEHTHFFSHHGEGGHYHYDTTPDTVEYLGYFLPAEFLYRIDQPKESHSIGRD